MNILVLDTSDNKRITVGLIVNGKKNIQTRKMSRNNEQVVLPMIDKILKKHSLTPQDIQEIKINPGPGSFTGLRIGLAIANAFSFINKIKVNGSKRIILPIYA